MAKRRDFTGVRFGRLTALSFESRQEASRRRIYWHCICSCGNYAWVQAALLSKGKTKSCGCLRKESTGNRVRTHGMTKTKEFRAWMNMKSRCNNSNDPRYPYYGGRGIAIDPEWQKFENFFRDMGHRPEGFTLERIDNNGDYSPKNCKWASWFEQNRNQRSNKQITHEGLTMCVTDWANLYEVSPTLMLEWIRKGWDTETVIRKAKDLHRSTSP